MKLALSASAPKADLLVLLLHEKEKLTASQKKALNKQAKDVEARIKAKDFEAKAGQSIELFGEKRLVLLGLGNKKKPGIQAYEKTGGTLAKLAKAAKAKNMVVMTDDEHLAEIATGLVLGNYSFDRYKEKPKKAPVKLSKVTFATANNKHNKEILSEAEGFAKASALTRDLVNTPAGDLNTSELAAEARKVAKTYKMKIKVMGPAELKKMGCGGLIGVGQGAADGPRMVVMEYKHKTKSKVPNIAFLGKGIVFDTGGLNLKPTGYMETMKQDMGGAATVLGAATAIGEAKLSGYYVFVLAIAENAISDKATRPGDVLKSYNGKSIEVTNTDAEGRLVLADALAYTEKKIKPKRMVNIATLTGAVSVALGYHITGIMGNKQSLIDQAKKAADRAHERLWQLPLDEDFIQATKGEFTDVKNSTNGVRAGASMGGAFLSNFVDKVDWAHFDIGGTAWAEKPSSTTSYGATAVMIRTFFELAKHYQG